MPARDARGARSGRTRPAGQRSSGGQGGPQATRLPPAGHARKETGRAGKRSQLSQSAFLLLKNGLPNRSFHSGAAAAARPPTRGWKQALPVPRRVSGQTRARSPETPAPREDAARGTAGGRVPAHSAARPRVRQLPASPHHAAPRPRLPDPAPRPPLGPTHRPARCPLRTHDARPGV